ncbi:MAG: PmoA family protein [Phycisphaerae bacterium]|nr:PmoA family protein [Phycisphaerae bacterium]
MTGNRVPTIAAVLLGILMLLQTAGAQQIIIDANTVTVRTGSTNLLQYRYANVPFKPYIKELCTPSGVNVLLDAPPDHLHHHGLMFAYAVDNIDFWGEAVGPADGHFELLPGKQQHRRFSDEAVTELKGRRLARFHEYVRWVSQSDSALLLSESRTVTAGRIGKPEATFLAWGSRLSAPLKKKPVALSGSHYHGLGMRFVQSMDATGEFRNPDNNPGVIFRGEERLVRSRWCAYTAQADGKTVTVAMFDHPENPRFPATWFTMAKPFAYMSATLRLHEEPLEVSSLQPLTLRYGVALWDGRPETEQIDAVYKEWVKMEGPL